MPLTWRDTAAPNFQTSVDATRLAGQSVNNAFSGLSDALGKFHEWQQGQAGNELANNLANYPDVVSQQKAAADGTLWQGVDRANLTPDQLKGVNSNVSTLLSNAADQAKLPYVAPQAAANVAATSAGADLTGAQAGGVRQNTSQGGITFADIQAGNALAAKVAAESGNDPDLYNSNMEKERTNGQWTPGAYQHAMSLGHAQIAAQNAGKAPGAIAGAASAPLPPPEAGSTEAFTNAIGIPETKAYIKNTLPNLPDLTGMTNEEKAAAIMPILMNKGEQSGGQMTDSQGRLLVSSKGATGAAQVEPETFAAMKAAHPDITGPITDRDSNIKAGQYYLKSMLDRYNGDPARALAAYNAGPGRVDDWNKAAGAAPPPDPQAIHTQLLSSAAGAVNNATLADAKANAGSIANQYTTLMKDPTPIGDLIQQLKDPKNPNAVGGQFSTVDPDIITRAVSDVKARFAAAGAPPPSDALAMGLLNKYGAFHKAGWFTTNSGLASNGSFLGYTPGRDGIALENPTGLSADIAKMSGNPDELAAQNQKSNSIAMMSKQISDAAAAESAAYQKYNDDHWQKSIHPDYDTSLSDAKLKAAQNNLAAKTAALNALKTATAPSGSTPPATKNANPKVPPSRGATIPVIPTPPLAPTATNSAQSPTALLAAAMRAANAPPGTMVQGR